MSFLSEKIEVIRSFWKPEIKYPESLNFSNNLCNEAYYNVLNDGKTLIKSQKGN